MRRRMGDVGAWRMVARVGSVDAPLLLDALEFLEEVVQAFFRVVG